MTALGSPEAFPVTGSAPLRRLGSILTAALVFRFYRRWHLRWGTTDTEANARFEGDDLIVDPRFTPTRAVTINASPEQVWPWIVQIGIGRAGFYSYDWLDNLGRPSTNKVLQSGNTLRSVTSPPLCHRSPNHQPTPRHFG